VDTADDGVDGPWKATENAYDVVVLDVMLPGLDGYQVCRRLKHGHPAAVVISVEDLESLEETIDVMGSEALLGDIREALAELAVADAPVLSKDQALRLVSGQ
jgi:DNA-binding response OmpR family regulator